MFTILLGYQHALATCILPKKVCHFTLLQVKVSDDYYTNDESIINAFNETVTVTSRRCHKR